METSPAEVSLVRFCYYVFDIIWSAKPTVGRFALGPPHNVTIRKKIKVPITYYRIRSREISRLTPPDDEAKYRSAWFEGGARNAPTTLYQM